MMRNLITFIIACFITVNSLEAQDCNYLVNKTDPFTKETTKEVYIDLKTKSNNSIDFNLGNKNGNYYLIFKMEYTNYSNDGYSFYNSSKSKLLLLSDTGDVITTLFIETVSPNQSALDAALNAVYEDENEYSEFVGGKFWVSEEVFQKLERARITQARVKFISGNYDFEISSPNAIKKATKCVE